VEWHVIEGSKGEDDAGVSCRRAWMVSIECKAMQRKRVPMRFGTNVKTFSSDLGKLGATAAPLLLPLVKGACLVDIMRRENSWIGDRVAGATFRAGPRVGWREPRVLPIVGELLTQGPTNCPS